MMCDLPTVYEEQQRTARKQHQCCECSRPIEPGRPYMECRGLWSGAWRTFRRCLRCHRIADRLTAEVDVDYGHDPCNAPVFGGVRETLQERIYSRHRWAKVWAGMLPKHE